MCESDKIAAFNEAGGGIRCAGVIKGRVRTLKIVAEWVAESRSVEAASVFY